MLNVDLTPEPTPLIPSASYLDAARIDLVRELTAAETEDSFDNLVATFAEQSKLLMEALESSRRDQRWKEFKVHAYSLKGAAADLGVSAVVTICAEIDERAGRGEAAALDACLKRLEAELDQARHALQAELES